MEMGTGKSLTAIMLAKIRLEKVDKVVWFCPVSLKLTIKGEILKHTDCSLSDICVFDDKITDESIPDAMWYIIGIESMGASARVILTAHKLITERTMVVLDESTYCKNHKAKRTMRITHLSKNARYRLIMTGTPLTNGIPDLYAQMYFLSPKILGYNSFYSFAANHLEYSDKYPGLVTRAHNTEFLAAKIKPYVYQVTKKECLDLPSKKYKTEYFSLTDEQQHCYWEAKTDFLERISQSEHIKPYMIFQLFTKLQQIVSGFIVSDERVTNFEHRRLTTLLESIQHRKDDKIIIWAKYRNDIERITDELRKEYGHSSVSQYYGDIDEKARDIEIGRFRNGARFLVATPSTGGHGLTLNESSRVYFYNNSFKYSEREQAEDRCHRIGQNHDVYYTDIHCSGTIDDKIWQAITKKESALHEFKREIECVKKEQLRELVMSL